MVRHWWKLRVLWSPVPWNNCSLYGMTETPHEEDWEGCCFFVGISTKQKQVWIFFPCVLFRDVRFHLDTLLNCHLLLTICGIKACYWRKWGLRHFWISWLLTSLGISPYLVGCVLFVGVPEVVSYCPTFSVTTVLCAENWFKMMDKWIYEGMCYIHSQLSDMLCIPWFSCMFHYLFL